MFFFALSAFIILTIIIFIFSGQPKKFNHFERQLAENTAEFEKRRQDFDKAFAETRKRFQEEHEKHFSHSKHLAKKPPITIEDIPDNKIPIKLSTRRGTVIEVRKNMSYGSEVREIWLNDQENNEFSCTLYGNIPVRKGHTVSIVKDMVAGAICGVINHNTNRKFNLVPDITTNQFMEKFVSNPFFKTTEAEISAWGDQNVHVRPIVEHHLVEILDSTQNT